MSREWPDAKSKLLYVAQPLHTGANYTLALERFDFSSQKLRHSVKMSTCMTFSVSWKNIYWSESWQNRVVTEK